MIFLLSLLLLGKIFRSFSNFRHYSRDELFKRRLVSEIEAVTNFSEQLLLLPLKKANGCVKMTKNVKKLKDICRS